MKSFCRYVVFVTGVGLPPVAALLLSSCGGGSTGAPETDAGSADGTLEAAPDGSPDVSPDAPTIPDSTVDGGIDGGGGGDATIVADADANTPTADASDAGADAADSTADVATDAAADVASDVVDNSAIYAFPAQVVAALCNQAAVCCFGDASANFNVAKCESGDLTVGFQGSSHGSAFLDSGNVAFNPTKASACLADLAAIDCRTNQLTTADVSALYPDCFGALQGTLPLGAVCNGSIECAPGEFCEPGDSGTTGTCQAVRTADAGCGDFGTPASPTSDQILNAQSICSYRGSGNTGLVCEYEDRATGNALPTWSCVPSGALGGNCSYPLDCTSKLCPPTTYTCGQATEFFNATGCMYYEITDGG